MGREDGAAGGGVKHTMYKILVKGVLSVFKKKSQAICNNNNLIFTVRVSV